MEIELLKRNVAPTQAWSNGLTLEQQKLLKAMAAQRGLSPAAFVRVLETQAEFGALQIDGADDGIDRAVRTKKERDREHEQYRKGKPRQRAPRGSVIVREGGTAILVPRAEIERRAKVTRAELEAAPAAFRASYFATPTRQDNWLAWELRGLLEELSGFPRGLEEDPVVALPSLLQEVPGRKLEELRRAWEGANGPIADYWKKELRQHVLCALPFRQAGGEAPLPGDGESILKFVVGQSPPDTVPGALTGDKIELILKTSTVTRGGGTKGRSKNVDVALDELISAVKAAGGGTR